MWVFRSITFLAIVLTASTVFSKQVVGPDKIYIRFTNLRNDDAKICLRVHIVPNYNKPFGWDGRTSYVGYEESPKRLPSERWLDPGHHSPWVDIGAYMNKRGRRSPHTYLSPVLCGVLTANKKPGLHLLAEVAEERGQRLIRRIEIHKKDLKTAKHRNYPWILGYATWNKRSPFLPTLGLLIPTRPDIASRIYTLEEAMRWQLETISKFPRAGRLPTQIVFKTRARQQIFQTLGYNGYPDDTVEADLGDEISIRLKIPIEKQNRRFRKHLKAQGFDPLELIPADQIDEASQLNRDEQWRRVLIHPALVNQPKHYYESANFRYRLWYEELAARTEQHKKKHPDKRVLAGANFSPHMNVWPDVRQWVGPFRAGAMTMTWTEDWWWQIPEISPQVYGFLLDAFRLAHSYHGAPAQFYVMPFRGNSPDNIRRMNSMALAHGAKILNHFHTESQVLTTWDYVSVMDSPRTYQAIHDVIREVGTIEHRLHPAMPAPAPIAILLSRASDTWDTEDLGGSGKLYHAKFNINNEERKAIWLALRHAQYPVDLITDEDVADGRLESYKVLYIVGSEMLKAAAKPLKQWVHAGGIVYASGGGGLLDEYHNPLTILYEMYGLQSHKLVRHSRHIRPRNMLATAKVHDTLVITGLDGSSHPITVPTLFYRESLQVQPPAQVLGVYRSDQSAGMVVNHFGHGRTIYCGALLGLAYLRPAVTNTSQVLPTNFPANIRRVLATSVRWSEIPSPVQTSDPLVEAQYCTSSKGDIVLLINWRDTPIDNLMVRFPGRRQIRSVRSLRQAGYFKGHLHEHPGGELEVASLDGIPQIQLPLGISDYLLVD